MNNFLQRLTIRERLISGYGLLILILLVGGGFTLFSLHQINDARIQIGKSVETAADSVTSMRHANDAARLALLWEYPVVAEKGALTSYILEDDDEQRKALFAEFARYGDQIKNIGEQIDSGQLTGDAKEQLDKIQHLQDQIRNAAIDVIAAFDGEAEYGEATKRKMRIFSTLLESLRHEINQFQDRNNKEVGKFKIITDGSIEKITTFVDSANRGIAKPIRSNIVVNAIGIIFAIIIAVFMYRSIVPPLWRASKVAERVANYDLREGDGEKIQGARRDEVSSLITHLASMRSSLANLMRQTMGLVTNVSGTCVELTSTAQAVDVSSLKQLQYVKESSASTSQMKDMAIDLAKSATEAASCAEEADGIARSSVEKDAKQTLEIIGAIEKEVDAAHLQIRTLWEATEKVTSILTVINEIADQTNLLALNAAIEAARAGEQGRGFAVVADEVRALAKRTTESTSQIESTVSQIRQETTKAIDNMENIQGRVVSGAESVSGMTGVLTHIQTLVARLLDISHGVATAAEEQSVEAANIAKNLDELEKESEQLNGEASAITDRSNGLLETVDKLKLEVSRFVI